VSNACVKSKCMQSVCLWCSSKTFRPSGYAWRARRQRSTLTARPFCCVGIDL